MHQLGMPTYQINRILAWLNPFDYAQTTTYQQAQGQIAIGSNWKCLVKVLTCQSHSVREVT